MITHLYVFVEDENVWMLVSICPFRFFYGIFKARHPSLLLALPQKLKYRGNRLVNPTKDRGRSQILPQ
jgi:hypothetical protein